GPAQDLDMWLAKPLRQSELYNALLDAATRARAPQPVQPRQRTQPGVVEGAAAPPAGPPAPPTALRVLLAEDPPVNQKLAARMLDVLGHQVGIVGDGRQALEALEAGEFDVILMDVQMPVMDGFEAVACIRALSDPIRRLIPIVALTAHAMKGDRERCLA